MTSFGDRSNCEILCNGVYTVLMEYLRSTDPILSVTPLIYGNIEL